MTDTLAEAQRRHMQCKRTKQKQSCFLLIFVTDYSLPEQRSGFTLLVVTGILLLYFCVQIIYQARKIFRTHIMVMHRSIFG